MAADGHRERRAVLVEDIQEFVLKYAHDPKRGHADRVRNRKISDKSAELVLRLLTEPVAPHKPRTGAAGRAEARADALRDVAEVRTWLRDVFTPHDLELFADAPAKQVEQAEPAVPHKPRTGAAKPTHACMCGNACVATRRGRGARENEDARRRPAHPLVLQALATNPWQATASNSAAAALQVVWTKKS